MVVMPPAWRRLQCSISGGKQTFSLERAGHSACDGGDGIYVFGGRKGSNFYNDVLHLDVHTGVWSKLATKGIPPIERAHHTATLIGRKMWIVGGSDKSTVLSDVAMLNLDTLEWSQQCISGDLSLLCRTAHAAEVHPNDPNAIFLSAGYGGSPGATYNFINSLVVLHTDSLSVEALSPVGSVEACPRGYHSMTIVNNRCIIIGGRTDPSRTEPGCIDPGRIMGPQCVAIYEFTSQQWILPLVAGAPLMPGRSSHRAALLRDRIVLYGGTASESDSDRLADVVTLLFDASLSRLEWSNCDSPSLSAFGSQAPRGRAAFASCLLQKRAPSLLVICGYAGTQPPKYPTDSWILDLPLLAPAGAIPAASAAAPPTTVQGGCIAELLQPGTSPLRCTAHELSPQGPTPVWRSKKRSKLCIDLAGSDSAENGRSPGPGPGPGRSRSPARGPGSVPGRSRSPGQGPAPGSVPGRSRSPAPGPGPAPARARSPGQGPGPVRARSPAPERGVGGVLQQLGSTSSQRCPEKGGAAAQGVSTGTGAGTGPGIGTTPGTGTGTGAGSGSGTGPGHVGAIQSSEPGHRSPGWLQRQAGSSLSPPSSPHRAAVGSAACASWAVGLNELAPAGACAEAGRSDQELQRKLYSAVQVASETQAALESEVLQLREREKRMHEQWRNTEIELTSTRQRLTETQGDLTSTRQRLSDSQAELSSTRQRQSETQVELTSTRQRLSEALLELSSRTQELNGVYRELPRLQAAQDEAAKQLKASQEELRQCREHIRDRDSSAALLSQQNKELVCSIADLRMQLERAQQVAADTGAALDEKRKDLLVAQEAQSTAQDTINSMSKMLAAAQAKAQGLEDALAEARCRAAQTQEAHSSSLAEAEARHESTRSELKAVQARLASAEQSCAQSHAEVMALEVRLRAEQEGCARLEVEKKAVEGENHALRVQSRSKDEELGALGEDIRAMEACMRSLTRRFARAQSAPAHASPAHGGYVAAQLQPPP